MRLAKGQASLGRTKNERRAKIPESARQCKAFDRFRPLGDGPSAAGAKAVTKLLPACGQAVAKTEVNFEGPIFPQGANRTRAGYPKAFSRRKDIKIKELTCDHTLSTALIIILILKFSIL